MKNVITTTLLCGALASTVFIVNCQKAPSRKVKATPSGTTTATADSLKKLADEGLVADTCSAEVATTKTELEAAIAKIKTDVETALKNDSSLESGKETPVREGRLAVIEKLKAFLAATVNMPTKDGKAIQACVSTATSSDKTSKIYKFSEINVSTNQLIADAGQFVGAKDQAQTDALKAILEAGAANKRNQATLLADKLESKDEVELMAPISEAIKKQNVNRLYVSDGKMQINPDTSEVLKTLTANTKKTICFLSKLNKDDVTLVTDGSKKTIVTSVTAVAKNNGGRSQSIVTFLQGDTSAEFVCLIAEDKLKVFAKEIRGAFGPENLLQKQELVEKKEAAAKQELANKNATGNSGGSAGEAKPAAAAPSGVGQSDDDREDAPASGASSGVAEKLIKVSDAKMKLEDQKIALSSASLKLVKLKTDKTNKETDLKKETDVTKKAALTKELLVLGVSVDTAEKEKVQAEKDVKAAEKAVQDAEKDVAAAYPAVAAASAAGAASTDKAGKK